MIEHKVGRYIVVIEEVGLANRMMELGIDDVDMMPVRELDPFLSIVENPFHECTDYLVGELDD